MSERERWIVYPLLFFALGAALRDKILQTVEAKEIVCERLRIVDRTDPNAILAELGSRQIDRNGVAENVTVLRVDELLCESLNIADRDDPTVIRAEFGSKQTVKSGAVDTTTVLRVDELLCEGVNVVDREDPTVVLIVLGSSTTPNVRPGEAPRRSGFVQVRDDVEQGLVSELRADQFIGTRLVTRQLLVLDPVNSRPLVYAGTEAMGGVSLDGEEPVVSYQGVIYLNNEKLGLRLAPPRTRQPASGTSPSP